MTPKGIKIKLSTIRHILIPITGKLNALEKALQTPKIDLCERVKKSSTICLSITLIVVFIIKGMMVFALIKP